MTILLIQFHIFSRSLFIYIAKLDGVSEKARQRLAEHDSINDWLEIADEDDKNETNGRKKKRVSYMIFSISTQADFNFNFSRKHAKELGTLDHKKFSLPGVTQKF